MLNINHLYKTGNIHFRSASQNPMPENRDKRVQNNQISNVTPDYNVKAPLTYKKIEEINLPFNTKAHVYKLSNGQKVVIIPNEGETVVKTYVNTGSMNEPDDLRGISHYIEHNLFNGSDGLEAGEFFKKTDEMGANTNASTSFAETNYYIKSFLLNDGDLEKKIKIHASMLESPRFAVNMLEKEKGIVNSEINMITSNPENIGFNRTIKNLFNIKSSSNDLIAGSTNNITNLTRDAVTDYFNKNYYPANMVTVISGEVTPDETIKLASKYFTSTKTPQNNRHFETLTPIEKPVREDILSDKATSTFVAMGFKGPDNSNTKDRILLQAFFELLLTSPSITKYTNPLNIDIFANDEKISTENNAPRAIILCANTNEENSEKLLKILYQQITKRQNTDLNDEEMQVIKKRMLRNLSTAFEYSEDMNNLVGEALLENNINLVKDYEKIINEMTAEDLKNIARKYFDLSKTAITVIHPKNAPNIQGNYHKAQTLSFTGRNQAINMNNVEEYNMPSNNMKIVLNNTKTPNTSFMLTFNIDEPVTTTKPATPFILNSLLNEGSAYRTKTEYSTDNAKKGIVHEFSSSDKNIVVSTSCDAGDIQSAIKNAKEVLLSPRFTERTLQTVKNNLKDNFSRSEKSPYNKLNKELLNGTMLGHTDEEILNNIDSVTLDDVKKLHSDIINSAKTSIVVSAPFSQKPELKNRVFEEASLFPKAKEFKPVTYKIFKPQTETKILTDIYNKNQAQIVMAYKFKVNHNLKDTATLVLLNEILGGSPSSRLFSDLREQQKLAYSVRSNFRNLYDIGIMELTIGTTTENNETGEVSYDNLQKSIEGFQNHIAKLKTEKVSEKELESAKLAIKNRVFAQNESGEDKTTTLDYDLLSPYGLTRINELLKIIDSITPEDIFNAANYVFKEKPVYSIVATENTLKANKEYLNSLTV